MMEKSCLLLLLVASPVGVFCLGRKAQGEIIRRGPPAPFDVVFDVALKGDLQESARFTVRVYPEWAPKGAAQFKRLVEQGWYNDAGVFRVVPGFVAQFGLPARPQPAQQAIPDDEVTRSNARGTVTFATSGPNTRSSQIFINFGDNSYLDGSGFAPFGEVLGDGMAVVDKFWAGYGEDPDQGRLSAQGNAYLDASFPKTTKFTRVSIQAPAGCVDSTESPWGQSCAAWLAQGACTTSSGIREHCKVSCQQCSPSTPAPAPAASTGCTDTQGQLSYGLTCVQWALRGDCAGSQTLQRDCPGSCAEVSKVAYSLTCAAWQKRGDCPDSNGLKAECPHLCGQCR